MFYSLPGHSWDVVDGLFLYKSRFALRGTVALTSSGCTLTHDLGIPAQLVTTGCLPGQGTASLSTLARRSTALFKVDTRVCLRHCSLHLGNNRLPACS